MLWPCRLVALGLALGASAVEIASKLEGLKIEVTKMPKKCDLKSMNKDYLEMHYTTKIAKSSKTGKAGMQIDTSKDAAGLNDPLSFQLGSGRVIKGWDEGVHAMCEGEVRSLTIDPEHAYGDEAYEQKNSDGEEVKVPPGATLMMEVELVKIIRLQKEVTFKPKKCPKKAGPGDNLKVHYTLWIHPTSMSGDKGSMVESSHDGHGEPMEFVLGAGRVIPGWDQGLEGMCEGEKIELIVPHEFGYGQKGQGDKIPPMATLHFEVELLEASETNMFQQMDTNNDGKIDIEELGVFMKTAQNLKDPEIIKKIFEGEDKNNDGFIDWDEAPFPKGEAPKVKGEKPKEEEHKKDSDEL